MNKTEIINKLCESSIGSEIVSALTTGVFGVIGATIPIGVILFVLFHKHKKAFLEAIKGDESILEKYEASVSEIEVMISDLQAHIDNGLNLNTDRSQEIMSYQGELRQRMLDYEIEIVNRVIHIKRMKNATFIGWIGHYFTKSYLADYFKK